MLIAFPGQGSQKVGMGADLYERFPCARDAFHEVDDAISYKLSNLMFNGTEEELKLTENAQPAIMAVSVAIVRVLKEEFGIDIAEKAKFFAGHSLGEYSALCAAGVTSLAETARILRVRGKAMAEAHPKGGAMAAIIGLDIDAVERLVESASVPGEVLQIGNDNAPKQIVISGHSEAVERAIEKAKEAGARRALKLNVSGPFHCALMEKAVAPLREALESTNFKSPSKPIISNVTAKAEKGNFKELLLKQLTSRVRWTETILFAKQNSALKCVEIGAGHVLTGLVKQIADDIETINLNSADSLPDMSAKLVHTAEVI